MNPPNDSNEQFLKQVLHSIYEKMALSLSEFEKTDLNADENIEQVKQWYARIAESVQKNPPTKQVRCFEIQEGANDNISSINYVYYDTTLIGFSENDVAFSVNVHAN